MKLISRDGRTIAGDVKLMISWHGLYFAVGRLDGGLNFLSPRSWCRSWYSGPLHIRGVLGPFDLMWSRRQSC